MVSETFVKRTLNTCRMGVRALIKAMIQQITARKEIQLLKKNWVESCPQARATPSRTINIICTLIDIPVYKKGLIDEHKHIISRWTMTIFNICEKRIYYKKKFGRTGFASLSLIWSVI